MSEPNLAKRLGEINYFVYDGVYEYITASDSKNIVPKFKEYKFPSINDDCKKEVKENNKKLKSLMKELQKNLNL